VSSIHKPFSRADVLSSIERDLVWDTAAEGRDPSWAELQRRRGRLVAVLQEAAIAHRRTLEALLEVFYARTPQVLAHARRVAAAAVSLGETLGLDQTALGHLHRAALAHDIGKKAVPDAVLAKAGPLSDEEIAMVHSHVTIGYELLSTSPFLRPAAEILLASQERFDGTGYPAGLRGPAIPLGARILAIADAFDALASARVHRDPMSRDDANVEIVRGAGSQFDPEIVRAWLMTSERTTCC
jgi:response regulator RpfG family c-di-GMP phosphodiesterase